MLTNSGSTGAKTDAAGDDIGESTAATRTVSVRAGSGATATVGGTVAPNDTIPVVFRATVDRAATGVVTTDTLPDGG